MSEAVFLSAGLDREATKPLFQQLYEAIAQAVRAGRIDAGEQLPASRMFAREIGVSRATVLAAYDQLVAEGYAEARQGAGLFATDISSQAREWLQSPRLKQSTPDQRPKPVPFAPGNPDMRAFPTALWAQYTGRVARADGNALLESPDPFGDWPLRLAITQHLKDWRGVDVSPSQVVITAGAADAAELVMETLLPKGGKIGLEDPGYQVLTHTCRSLGRNPVWLSVDEDGAQVPSDPEVGASIITPSSQFPLGGTMPVARRQAHLDFATLNHSWVIEDDFDSEFRYAGAPVPALMALDRTGRVIYLGSFSKVFSAGMRLGYLVFPQNLIDDVRTALLRRGGRASVMPQRVLARFMEDGAFHKHVRKMRRLYRGRRQAFLSGVETRFDGLLQARDHGSGMSVVLDFQTDIDTDETEARLIKAGLNCPMLTKFYNNGQKHRGLLCGFCAFDEEEIADGLDRLAMALRS